MYDESEKIIERRKAAKVVNKAITKYAEVAKDVETIRNILIVDNPINANQYMKMDEEDLGVDMHRLLTGSPEKFVKLAEDKNLDKRALLEKYIATGILIRNINTKIIVDAVDITKVIGYTDDEAIIEMANDKPESKKYFNELDLRFKQVIKNS